MTTPAITIGTRVRWTSQSGGRETTKIGKVLYIIRPGRPPEIAMGVRNPGSARDHVSYVVTVPRKGRKGRRYWPRVELLEVLPPP